MESTVTAPYAGEVTAVEVMPNAQVSTGAPLVRIREVERPRRRDGRSEAARPDRDGGPARAGDATVRARLRLPAPLPPRLRPRPGHAAAAAGRATQARRDQPPADPGLLRCEDGLLDLFARGERALPSADRDPARRRADLGQHAGVPARLSCSGWTPTARACPTPIARASWPRWPATGSTGSTRTPELEAAVVWMFRSFSRVGELVPVVMSILERRLRARRELAPLGGRRDAGRFDRLAASAQIRHQAVAELAHDVVFRYFDEPVLEALGGVGGRRDRARARRRRGRPERSGARRRRSGAWWSHRTRSAGRCSATG